MAVIQRKYNVAPAETITNAVAGSAFEFPQQRAIVSCGVLAVTGDVFITIQAGSDVILEESVSAVGTGFPRIPDEMYYNFAVAQGDRLVVKLRNDNAAAQDVNVLLQMTPV
jgi:Ni,Fe-hydrogenase III small subunit